MTHGFGYTRYHPRWYRKRTPIFWWVRKWSYVRFILRELSSIFVAFYALVLLLLVRAVAQGPMAYAAFLDWLRSPLALAVHVIAFVFVLFHSITWFNLAPSAMVVRIGPKQVPGVLIQAANYGAWIVVSLVVAWILLKA